MTHKYELPEGSKLELPSDFWAEMKDGSEITRGERKAAENGRTRAAAVAAEVFAGDTSPEGLAALRGRSDEELWPFEEYQNLLLKTCLVSWSRGALPADPADFNAMPDDVYEALVIEARLTIFKDPLEFGPDGAADPKAPTASSDGSGPPSGDTPDLSVTTTPTQP